MGKGEGREVIIDSVGAGACPECEGNVETIEHPDVFTYGEGESAVELDVVLPVRRCPSCGFEFLDHEAERIKHDALCRHFGVLTPWEIREIRERHGLSRAAFAKLTGLGEATLRRWETGVLIQNIGNDRYLRLLAQPGGIASLDTLVRSTKALAGKLDTGPRPAGPRFRCLRLDEQTRRLARDFRLRRAA